MKIDLLKDKGLLDPQEFQERVAPDLRTDSVIERADHESKVSKPTTGKPEPPPIPPNVEQPRESVRGLFVVLAALAIIIVLGFLYKQGRLDPIITAFMPEPTLVDTADTTMDQTDFPFMLDSLEVLRIQDSLSTVLADSVLPQDVFEQLLPVPSYVSTIGEDTLIESHPDASPDTTESESAMSETSDPDSAEESAEPPQEMVTHNLEDTTTVDTDVTRPERHFTHLDSQIVTNQTMFQLAADLVSILNQSGGKTDVYLDRHSVKVETNNGKEGVRETVYSAIRPITDGTLKESVQTAGFIITGKYQYIYEIPPTYARENGDIYFILEKLVGPFSQYINHIITEMERGIDENPVQIRVAGNHWVMRSILEHWGQLPLNFILNNLTIQQDGDGYETVVNLTLIRYE